MPGEAIVLKSGIGRTQKRLALAEWSGARARRGPSSSFDSLRLHPDQVPRFGPASQRSGNSLSTRRAYASTVSFS